MTGSCARIKWYGVKREWRIKQGDVWTGWLT